MFALHMDGMVSAARGFAGVLFALALGACGHDERLQGELDFSAFDAAVANFLSEKGLSGAGAVVVHRDRGIVHERAYGAHTQGRISLVASSSKILSAAVLVRLSEQGLLDLDAPISTYLGAWGTHKTDISVAQLLSNSSGLVGIADDPSYALYSCQHVPNGTLSDCAKRVYTAEDAADRLPPDTQWRYGGGAWQLAGGIAEVVSGKTWAELIEETYGPCSPETLGYTNQYERAFSSGGGLSTALSYPAFFSGDVATLPRTDNPNVEGGAYTTVLAYGKILLMHLRGGVCDELRVLSAEGVARMQEDRIAEHDLDTYNERLAGYGLGWWVSRKEPGYVVDAGAYGTVPWIDSARNYGAYLLLEASSTLGMELHVATKPILDEIFDAAAR
ncbi:MAG TPA: serine hydrolase domain-containing protein [Polyangiaceae bacterium]|nr:serine hydrolase domain-containing protein [Polyangiaceae bacterium]